MSIRTESVRTIKRKESNISSIYNMSPLKEREKDKEKEKEKDSINNDSDCGSLISEKDRISPEKKQKMDNILKSKKDGKSILGIAKDLNKTISVKSIY
jgi:hypothetical protein